MTPGLHGWRSRLLGTIPATTMPGRVSSAAYVLLVGALAVVQVAEPSGAVLAALVLTTAPWGVVAYVALVQVAYASAAEPAAWLVAAVVVSVWVAAALAQIRLVLGLGRWWSQRRGASGVVPAPRRRSR